MKQITKETVVSILQGKEIKLKPTQNKVCLPIVNRLYLKMCRGISFSGIKIADDLIIDGHHRYVASLLANYELETLECSTTSATVVRDWNLIEFTEDEWDTKEQIIKFNEIDAERNALSVDEIVALLK